MRVEFARSHAYQRHRFREELLSDQSTKWPKDSDCSKRLSRLVNGCRRPHETPSELSDDGGRPRTEANNAETEQRQNDRVLDGLADQDTFDDDVYRDCHYHRGSPYGYLVNRCPDFPLSVSASPNRGHHHAHFSDLDQPVRCDDILVGPGMVFLAMLVLLLTSIIIVEVADLIWKEGRADDHRGQKSTPISNDYKYAFVPQLELDKPRLQSKEGDIEEDPEVEERIM
jgi:hypothetical protein